MIDLVENGQRNKGEQCANTGCGFRFTKIKTRASHYDTQRRSWVCGACAQSINRATVGKLFRFGGELKQRCINSEDALMLMLTEGIA